MALTRRPALRSAVLAVAVVAALAGCSQVVTGTGSSGASGVPIVPSAPANSSSPDFPSQSAPSESAPVPQPSATPPAPSGSSPAAPVATACPKVKYPIAHLSFECITSGMTASADDQVWPLSEVKTVEPASKWVLEEGAGHWGPKGGHALTTIATEVRTEMLDSGSYLTSPKVSTVSSKDVTVGHVPAHVLQSTITLNPTAAKAAKTAVKQEKLWIVAVQVGSDDVSLWFVTVPDLVRDLWPKVPSVISSLAVI